MNKRDKYADQVSTFQGGDQEWAQKVIHGEYHSYVDGLRSLAVLPVVIYHLLMPACPAGFMGVDVFFVISGYLICGGIMRDLQKGTFSMTSFYSRRIRRIFPAYFVLCFVVLILGITLYHWARVVPLAQTTLFSSLFSTNLYFWLHMGYFQPNAHDNPLLNLWSLGVEEQFYIIIPLALLLVWKIRPRLMVPVILCCAVASLALCLVLGTMGQSTTAFYILPTRGWELLAGALIAALPRAEVSNLGKRLAELGLALLIFSFWCFTTERTFTDGGTSVELWLPFFGSLGIHPFPGWVTLPVIVGTLLLVRYGSAGPVGALLRWRPMVDIGKMSYSLYLWHWPIIVFVRYLNYEQPLSYWVLAGIIIASMLAAYGSWRFVEMPFRVGKGFTSGRAFGSLGLGCGILLAVCLALIGTDGLRHLLHRSANVYAAAPRPFMQNFHKFVPSPDFRPPPYPEIDSANMHLLGEHNQPIRFCLIGDSHAEAIAPGLDAVAKEYGIKGVYIGRSMHPFIQKDSDDTTQQLLEWVAKHPQIRDVYLVGRWMMEFRVFEGLPHLGDKGKIQIVRVDNRTGQKIVDSFRQTAQWFAAHGKRVYVFSCVPEYAYPIADVTARNQIIPLKLSIGLTRQDYLNRQVPVTLVLEQLQSEGIVTLVPLHEAFFDDDDSVFMAASGIPYYADNDHLTPEGARHAMKKFAPLLWGPNVQ